MWIKTYYDKFFVSEGYSTWTIESFNIETFQLGGHNIFEILKSLEGKYIYFVIDKVG